MKRITLSHNVLENHSAAPCAGRLLLVWGCYGFAMALLWRLASGAAFAEAAVWALALVAGAGLALRMEA